MRALVIFRSLLEDRTISQFVSLLNAADEDEFLNACASFEASLFETGDNWSEYLSHAVLSCDNPAVRLQAAGRTSDVIADALEKELAVLNSAASVTLDQFSFPAKALFAGWNTSECDLGPAYVRRLEAVTRCGYGIYADYYVFTFDEHGLQPVRYPDPQRLSELPGYEAERKRIIANVNALLDNRPAVNVLLYGDAGTGKSSTIKAIVNEFHHRGLRLVEVRRDQLFRIPALLEQLAEQPLKFILFIDDLSFAEGDDNFAALKAILEGSVARQASNTIIAATSNRRHLVREKASDRFSDDLHENDTRQEILSLSARFGLIITFQKPDKDRYLHIIHELAKRYGVSEDPQVLEERAEAFALRAGGRTPRTAKQFIEQIRSGVL